MKKENPNYYYQNLLKDEYLKGAKLLRYLEDKPIGVMDLLALRGFNFNIEMQLLNSLNEVGLQSDLSDYIQQLKSIQKTYQQKPKGKPTEKQLKVNPIELRDKINIHRKKTR